MEKYLKDCAEVLFAALREKRVLFVVDSTSKGCKAVFKLYYLGENNFPYSFAGMLKKLDFKESKRNEDMFFHNCAGSYSYYTMDAVGNRLRANGIELPADYSKLISSDFLRVL